MIDAWFDFRSPLSMLTRHLLTAELGNSETRVRWHPSEGGDEAWDPAWFAQTWVRSVRPMAERLGVRVNAAPPRPTSTRLALQGYQYALDQGRADAYSEQVFHAYFAESLDIGEPQALGMVAGRAGLDPERFGVAAASTRYAERHLAAVSQWPPVRVTPTVVCGGYRIEGVPNKAQLAKLVAASTRPRVRAGCPRPTAERSVVARFFEDDDLTLGKPVEPCGGI
jgi:predicted DsbA family dithiol-disulfide isomerase